MAPKKDKKKAKLGSQQQDEEENQTTANDDTRQPTIESNSSGQQESDFKGKIITRDSLPENLWYLNSSFRANPDVPPDWVAYSDADKHSPGVWGLHQA